MKNVFPEERESMQKLIQSLNYFECLQSHAGALRGRLEQSMSNSKGDIQWRAGQLGL